MCDCIISNSITEFFIVLTQMEKKNLVDKIIVNIIIN